MHAKVRIARIACCGCFNVWLGDLEGKSAQGHAPPLRLPV
jgi:hypothetical protein